MKKIITLFSVLGAFAVFTSHSYAGYFNSAPINSCDTSISGYLTRGSSGEDVSVLQDMLVRGGYLSASVNGYFGYATQAAVRAFQADNNLPQTGSVGPQTRDAVNERLCDADVTGSYGSYYDSYGYGYGYTGSTYVDPYDAYVKVISPTTDSYVTNTGSPYIPYTYTGNGLTSTIIPATTDSVLTTASIVYNPNIGYTYGIAPLSGSLTITSPGSNSSFHEGDTVNLNWATNNINASQYVVSLENISTGRNKEIALVSGNTYSFVLSKDMLDYVCAGSCNQYSQSQFNIVLTTPIRDIAGVVTNFKARVSPVTIIRPYYNMANVSITTGKSPVNSGELFKMYINILNNTYTNTWNYTQVMPYSFGITAICSGGVSVSIGGTNCGQEFSMPQTGGYTQKEIPVTIINTGWFTQNVTFNLTAYDQSGRIIGTASTTVQVNPAPRAW